MMEEHTTPSPITGRDVIVRETDGCDWSSSEEEKKTENTNTTVEKHNLAPYQESMRKLKLPKKMETACFVCTETKRRV
jgi:hypothetical protein